jgi:hypothetical protein
MHCVEWMHLIQGPDAKRLKSKDRLHFDGTTASDTMTGVMWPDPSTLWKTTFKRKKDMLGDARVAVGGRDDSTEEGSDMEVDEAAEDQPKKKQIINKRADSDIEPAFYHAPTVELMEEIMHLVSSDGTPKHRIRGVIDFTPGEGTMARAALNNNIPYFGLCFTESHAEAVSKFLMKCMWQEIKVEGGARYKTELATALESVGKDETDDEGKKKEDPKKKKEDPKKKKEDPKKKKEEPKKKPQPKKEPEPKKKKSAIEKASPSHRAGSIPIRFMSSNNMV